MIYRTEKVPEKMNRRCPIRTQFYNYEVDRTTRCGDMAICHNLQHLAFRTFECANMRIWISK